LSGKPFLGICLGLQLLLDRSEEGDTDCLGIIEGDVKRFGDDLKIPHMGWNKVYFNSEHPVFLDIPDGAYFYFIHSYYAVPSDASLISSTTEYGIEFCSSITFDNVVAVQFHPEKSGETGLKVYGNFVNFVNS
jgi:glutamine amidotransferase